MLCLKIMIDMDQYHFTIMVKSTLLNNIARMDDSFVLSQQCPRSFSGIRRFGKSGDCTIGVCRGEGEGS